MFDPGGTVLKRLANGTRELIRYGAGGRCCVKVIQPRGTGGILRRRYQYSQKGQLLAAQDDRLGETRFEYDAAGRLAARIPRGGKREEFRCDGAGNLIEQPRLEGVSIGPANQLRAANGVAFAYNTRQHVERITTPDGPVHLTYDEADQLVSRVSGKGEWTAEYDALGRRIAKRWAGRSVEFFWDDERLAAEIHDGGRCRIYIYPDAAALVPFMFVDYDSVDADPKKGRAGYIFCNQLGAPVEVQDETGATIWSATVEPYGYAAVAEGGSIEMNLRWPGHYFDAETGLHYNRHRYYDPRLGCYLQSDPIGLGGGFNVYAYTRDPLSRVDVNGLACDGAASKPKGAAEKPPPRKTAKAGDDLGDLAKEAGMEKKHLENLQKRSQEKGEIIVVRATNPNSLPYHGKPGYVSKPVDCKFKTDKGDGLVKKPKDPMSPEDAEHFKKLEEKGWTTDKDGNMLDPNKNKVYGDHDMQGVYEPTTHKDPFSGETHQGTHKVDTNDPAFQKGMNDDVCPENKMFNHGANDNYMDPKDPTKMGRTPGADESYIVTKPDGSVTQVNGTDELKNFYGENNIPWPY